MTRPALFLDRDGVINREVHRLHDPKDFELLDGVAEAIAAANQRGIPVVVVTNQAGIGHGLYTEAQYQHLTAFIREHLAERSATLTAVYHCPHTPAMACACRKPLPGMLLEAARDLAIDLPRSVLVGDKLSDLEAAHAAGCASVLVRTGYGAATERELGAAPSARVLGVFDRVDAALPTIYAHMGAR